MNTIREWIAGKPITAFLLAALFGSLPTAAGLRPDWIPYLGVLFCLSLLAMVFSMWKFTGPFILALAIVFNARPAEPDPQPAVPIGAAFVVICVGGFCVYKLVKFCQEKFPKDNGGSNSLTGFSATSSDEYGASWAFNSYGYCYEPAFQLASVENDDATTFNINVMVEAGGSLRTSMSAVSGVGTFQTFSEFQAEVAAHGLVLSDHSEASPHFERNRVPCDGEDVPLYIDPILRTITHSTGGTMRSIVVERSMNLVDWSPFLTTTVSEGTGFRVVDTTREGQMFYRVMVSPREQLRGAD